MKRALLASATAHCSPFSSPASSRSPTDPQSPLLAFDGACSSINLDSDNGSQAPDDHGKTYISRSELTDTILPSKSDELALPTSSKFLGPRSLGLGYRDSLGCLDKTGHQPVRHCSMSVQARDTTLRLSMPCHDGGADTVDLEWDEDDDHLALDAEHGSDMFPVVSRSSGIYGAEGPAAYDLKAPPPTSPASNIETLSERLFSVEHLKVILRDAEFYSRFSAFLSKYQPHALQSLYRYLDLQKALSAIDYANAIAEALTPGSTAAAVAEEFMIAAKEVVDELVNEALPKYITHKLVLISTETLVKEITKQNTPVMRELVAGLAEVYCLTDPSLPDNPIVYASEEFYRYTQYGKDYAIGRNCRFLQGPKSSPHCLQRLAEALSSGTEICETILNYRRDGSPFMNLLMIAPLYDNKGNIRYFIGAQIDVTGLITNGRGLDSFERLFTSDKYANGHGDPTEQVPDPQKALGELSQLFDETDTHAVKSGIEKRREKNSNVPTISIRDNSTGRKFVAMDLDDAVDRALWPASHLGSSGRLPGVFQNYLLVRPYPSLRITFTSPTLRIPGMPQSKFVDRIGGSVRIRNEIVEALSEGISVTARINWLPQGPANESPSSDSQNSTRQHPGPSNLGRDAYVNSRAPKVAGADSVIVGPDGQPGKPRWVHCTPLLGSDGKVGVWMVVLVESEFVTGALNASDRITYATSGGTASSTKPWAETLLSVNSNADGADVPTSHAPTSNRWSISKALKHAGRGDKLRGDKLYRDYLRREERPPSTLPVDGRDGAGFELRRHQEEQYCSQPDSEHLQEQELLPQPAKSIKDHELQPEPPDTCETGHSINITDTQNGEASVVEDETFPDF